MQGISDKLIVALDVSTLEEAKRLVDTLCPAVKLFKVGSQLFTAYGLEAVKMVGEKGAKVFLDLKFYDIPRTVFSAVASGSGLSCAPVFVSATPPSIEEDVEKTTIYPVFMMTVHSEGDIAMLRDAARGAEERAKALNIKKPFVVGVTVLTSVSGSGAGIKKIVVERARKAKEAGLDGVVCAVEEASMIRQEFGKDFLIVTPGIRPKSYKADDQSRVATAKEAIDAGADFIVVGRPILEARDPLKVTQELISGCKN
jgi:orotidine-5'-phosphate decarboxylase